MSESDFRCRRCTDYIQSSRYNPDNEPNDSDDSRYYRYVCYTCVILGSKMASFLCGLLMTCATEYDQSTKTF